MNGIGLRQHDLGHLLAAGESGAEDEDRRGEAHETEAVEGEAGASGEEDIVPQSVPGAAGGRVGP
jgi:hypothetical protein